MYEIQLADKVVGQAQVARQGLYYYIQCFCELNSDTIYRIVVTCGEKRLDLGVCVPTGKSFGLSTKVAIKRLGEGGFKFSLISQSEMRKSTFYPISTEAGFDQIELLPCAFFAKRNGQIGAVVYDEK